jgi:hypothetical protein
MTPAAMERKSTTFALLEHIPRGANCLPLVKVNLSVVGATLVGPVMVSFTFDSDWGHLERLIRYRVASFDLPIPDQGSWCPLRHPPSLMAIVGIGVPTF